MADEQRPSGPPGGKRPRPPTTIDVKATEIASDPVQPAEPADAPQEPVRDEKPAGAAAASKPQAESPPPPKQRGWRPEWPDVRARLSAGTNGRLLAASAAGAAVMLLVFVALWSLGTFSSQESDALAARVATLETQVRDLAAKPPGVGQRAIDDLAARLGAVEKSAAGVADLGARVAKTEQALAAPRAAQSDQALTARVAALESAVRPLSEFEQRIDAATAAARDAKSRADAAYETAQKNAAPRAEEAADRKDMDALAARVAALEQAAKSAEEKIARAAVSAGADRAGRLAFVAVSLRSAVERGEPYAQELAAAKPLVPDAAALAPLEPFATTGVPRSATLARELSQLTGAMLSAAGGTPREGGILDRLQQNAERLVRIRPISAAPGEDAAAIIARADAKASNGDIAGALAEISQLPDTARAPAQAWIKKAAAQVAALATARRLAEYAVGALGKAAP